MQSEKCKKWLRAGKLVLLVCVVTALEYVLAKSAWHTIGEIVATLMVFPIILNLPSLLPAVLGHRGYTISSLLPAFLLIVPVNCLLLLNWFVLNRQAHRVIAWAQTAKRQSGKYPADLSSYNKQFGAPDKEVKYQYHSVAEGKEYFAVRFHIGSDSTEHVYESDGGWWYYPD